MPGYPWLRVAGTVGLATVVPFTGGWVAVAALTVDNGGPSTAHTAAASVVPPGTPVLPQQTVSPAVVLNRSVSPSLEAVTRSDVRTPLDGRHLRRSPTRLGAPLTPTEQPSVKHRAHGTDESSPAADGGRHRAATDEQPTATPSRDDGGRPGPGPDDQQSTGGGEDGGQAQGGDHGQDSGPGHGGSPGAENNGGSGQGGHAYGHDRDEPQSNAHSHDGGGQEAGSEGSNEGGTSQSSGNAYGHGHGEGRPESNGNGNGR